MSRKTLPRHPSRRAPAAATVARRWLMFVHQLGANPSNLRVRTWRRLQQLGAVPLKQAVYVLPDTAAAREDFEWLRTEVKTAGGDAAVFAANSLDLWTDDELIEAFRRSRQEEYAALAADLETVLKRVAAFRQKAEVPHGGADATQAWGDGRLLATFKERLMTIERIDFFGAGGRDRVSTLLADLEARRSGAHPSRAVTGLRDRRRYQRRTWVTRPRPGVDRMSSAWLIRRFIDPRAQFGFAAEREAVAEGAVPFDMFGGEFSHQGDGCTFETLCSVFGIGEPAVARIAAIVHDLDLKDARFGAPEAPAIGAVIDGLRLAHADDETLLAQGMTLFESLYLAFAQAARTVTSPRARTATRSARKGRAGGRRQRAKR